MRFRSDRRASWTRPRTTVGLVLRSLVFSDLETRLRLVKLLNSGQPGWNEDEPAVAEAACELAFRRLLGVNPDPEAVEALVSYMCERAQDISAELPATPQQMEALIRIAAGDREAAIGEIRPVKLYGARLLLMLVACLSLRLDETDVDQLLADAEKLAFDRGFHPPLAS